MTPHHSEASHFYSSTVGSDFGPGSFDLNFCLKSAVDHGMSKPRLEVEETRGQGCLESRKAAQSCRPHSIFLLGACSLGPECCKAQRGRHHRWTWRHPRHQTTCVIRRTGGVFRVPSLTWEGELRVRQNARNVLFGPWMPACVVIRLVIPRDLCPCCFAKCCCCCRVLSKVDMVVGQWSS